MLATDPDNKFINQMIDEEINNLTKKPGASSLNDDKPGAKTNCSSKMSTTKSATNDNNNEKSETFVNDCLLADGIARSISPAQQQQQDTGAVPKRLYSSAVIIGSSTTSYRGQSSSATTALSCSVQQQQQRPQESAKVFGNNHNDDYRSSNNINTRYNNNNNNNNDWLATTSTSSTYGNTNTNYNNKHDYNTRSNTNTTNNTNYDNYKSNIPYGEDVAKNYGQHNNTIDDENDYQVREAIRLSKLEEEERLKKLEHERRQLVELREQQKWDLREALVNIVTGTDMSQQKLFDLKRLLTDYERDSGQSIYECYQIKQFRNSTVNDMSKLVLCVIRGLGGQVSMNVVASYFADHLARICLEFNHRNYLKLYDPTVHRRDPEAQMTHEALDDKLVCVHIKGDGNCLWSSVSTSIYGSDEYMESLRLLTASTLVDYRSSFEKSYKSDIPYDELIEKAVTLQEWGHELHIQALSLALHRPIYMYSSFVSLVEPYRQTYDQLRESYESKFIHNHMRFLADGSYEGKVPVLLYYNGLDHYSVVLPKRVGVRPLKPYTEMMEPMFNKKVSIPVPEPTPIKQHIDKSVKNNNNNNKNLNKKSQEIDLIDLTASTGSRKPNTTTDAVLETNLDNCADDDDNGCGCGVDDKNDNKNKIYNYIQENHLDDNRLDNDNGDDDDGDNKDEPEIDLDHKLELDKLNRQIAQLQNERDKFENDFNMYYNQYTRSLDENTKLLKSFNESDARHQLDKQEWYRSVAELREKYEILENESKLDKAMIDGLRGQLLQRIGIGVGGVPPGFGRGSMFRPGTGIQAPGLGWRLVSSNQHRDVESLNNNLDKLSKNSQHIGTGNKYDDQHNLMTDDEDSNNGADNGSKNNNSHKNDTDEKMDCDNYM